MPIVSYTVYMTYNTSFELKFKLQSRGIFVVLDTMLQLIRCEMEQEPCFHLNIELNHKLTSQKHYANSSVFPSALFGLRKTSQI